MWNPLNEPTHIQALIDFNNKMRLKYQIASLELYKEYWEGLKSIPANMCNELGDKAFEFNCKINNWKMSAPPSTGFFETEIKNELYLLNSLYDSVVLSSYKVNKFVKSVKLFLQLNPPTYKRIVRTGKMYPKYKELYGCCDANINSMPALGFTSCLCKTYKELCAKGEQLHNEVKTVDIFENIVKVQNLLVKWKNDESNSRKEYYSVAHNTDDSIRLDSYMRK